MDPYELEISILNTMALTLFRSGLKSAAQHRMLEHICKMYNERSELEMKNAYQDMPDGGEHD